MPDSAPSAPTDLHYISIADAADLIARKALSPVELTQAFVDRSTALDPQLNAYIQPTYELALAQAKTAEEEIAAGKLRGPLHGIPFGLKDVYGTAGIATTGHSRAYKDFVPAEDATSVAKLYEAGAVLLGKLSTHEGAHGGPSFDLDWPPARNPWNRDHFTGGSSSGSGAAVAAGLMPAAMGTDTGGSIRNPAGLCGLVGLKPTYGLISRRGVMANSFTYDHCGPMTWTVEDCALMMQALAGHDPKDPASANLPVPDYRAALTGDIKGMRIGVIRHLYEEDVPANPAVKDALEKAYDVLRGLGAILEDVRIRPAQDYYDVKIIGGESEIYSVHEHFLRKDPSLFGEDFLGRSLAAICIRSSDYVQALRERRLMLEEFKALYAKYDAFLTAGTGPAPRLDSWRTIMFWQKASFTTPFNVSGGPALSQCIGYTADGLPLSMQVVGKPFDDARVMQIAHAYEKATPWRARRPQLDPNASFSTALPPVPDPTPADISPEKRAELAALAKRAGLTLNARQFELLAASAPYMEAMCDRLQKKRSYYDEPSNTFELPKFG